MNTVVAKIPSVFHKNVDAEGKKKREEHERNPANPHPHPPPHDIP